jgi:hypothetical protein
MDEEDQLDLSCKNDVLNRVTEERNILHAIKRGKADWIYQALELLSKTRY